MRSSLRYFLIVIALFAVVLFAACSSDSDDDGDGDTGSEEPTSEQPVDDGDDDGDNGDGDDADSDGNDDAGDGDEVDASEVEAQLRDFAEQFGVKEFKIVYALSGGEGDLGLEGQMTMYFKPPDGFRVDFTSGLGDISFITRGDTTYSCFSEGGEGQCIDSSGTDDTFDLGFDFDNPEDLIGESGLPFVGGQIKRSDQVIAGIDAVCYAVDEEAVGLDDAGEVCFGENGALLRVADGTGEFSLEAIEVSESVSDADLEPPYEVLELGDLVP